MDLEKLLEKRASLINQIDAVETRDALDKLNLDLLKLDMQILEARKSNPTEQSIEAREAVEKGVPEMVKVGAKRNADPTESVEYRVAFANFVTRGTQIPMELRANATTKTGDVASVIPTTIANRIVEKMEIIGRFLPMVTRTSFATGYAIPTSSVKPVATWVAEGGTSVKQKNATGTVNFSYFKLRCEIAMTMEVSVTTLPVFEATFVRQVSEAMVKAQEEAIFNGDGTSQPKGILKEAVEVGQNIDIAAAKQVTYADLVNAEGALPEAYENGTVWVMAKKTYYNQVVGLVDTQGQPVARTNVGIDGKPEYNILGRKVIFTEHLAPYTGAKPVADTIVMAMFNFADYAFNTTYDMDIQRKQDWDTEDILTKAVLACDGKVVDKNSLVTVTKKSA